MDRIFHILTIGTPYEVLDVSPWVSAHDWGERETQKEKEIASMGNY